MRISCVLQIRIPENTTGRDNLLRDHVRSLFNHDFLQINSLHQCFLDFLGMSRGHTGQCIETLPKACTTHILWGLVFSTVAAMSSQDCQNGIDSISSRELELVAIAKMEGSIGH